jgi:hypothetical protein
LVLWWVKQSMFQMARLAGQFPFSVHMPSWVLPSPVDSGTASPWPNPKKVTPLVLNEFSCWSVANGSGDTPDAARFRWTSARSGSSGEVVVAQVVDSTQSDMKMPLGKITFTGQEGGPDGISLLVSCAKQWAAVATHWGAISSPEQLHSLSGV